MPDDPHINEVSEERDSDASLVSHQVDEKEVKGIDEDDIVAIALKLRWGNRASQRPAISSWEGNDQRP